MLCFFATVIKVFDLFIAVWLQQGFPQKMFIKVLLKKELFLLKVYIIWYFYIIFTI